MSIGATRTGVYLHVHGVIACAQSTQINSHPFTYINVDKLVRNSTKLKIKEGGQLGVVGKLAQSQQSESWLLHQKLSSIKSCA